MGVGITDTCGRVHAITEAFTKFSLAYFNPEVLFLSGCFFF